MRARLGLAVLVMLAAASLSAPAIAVDGAVTFRYASYTPSAVRITPGGKVTWTADAGNDFEPVSGSTHHPLQFVEPAISPMTSGTTGIRTFATAGVFHFYCANHGTPGGAGMAGTITVTANQLPIASFAVPPAVVAGQNTSLTAISSHDPDGQITQYEWDFDNNGTADEIDTAPATSHVFTASATVSLTVVDNNSDAVGPEPSVPFTQQITVSPAASSTLPSGPTQTGTPPRTIDRTPPKVAISTRSLHLSTLRGGHAKLSFSSSEAGAAGATLRAGSTIVATGRATYSRAGTHSLTLKLTPQGHATLRRAHRLALKLSLVVSDRTGNRAIKTHAFTHVS